MFASASQFDHVLILGDFNINLQKKKQLNIFINSSDLIQVHHTKLTFLFLFLAWSLAMEIVVKSNMPIKSTECIYKYVYNKTNI